MRRCLAWILAVLLALSPAASPGNPLNSEGTPAQQQSRCSAEASPWAAAIVISLEGPHFADASPADNSPPDRRGPCVLSASRTPGRPAVLHGLPPGAEELPASVRFIMGGLFHWHPHTVWCAAASPTPLLICVLLFAALIGTAAELCGAAACNRPSPLPSAWYSE